MGDVDIFKFTLEELAKLEGDDIKLKNFGAEQAFQLGSLARRIANERYASKSVVIDITLASGQVLFHSATGTGSAADNDEWVNRKKRLTLRCGKSSFAVGQSLRMKGKTMEEALFISSLEYASHGGSVPIRIESFDGLIGALTISGLAQQEDHLLAIDILKQFKQAN